jgi:hypothetical protein
LIPLRDRLRIKKGRGISTAFRYKKAVGGSGGLPAASAPVSVYEASQADPAKKAEKSARKLV